MAHLTVDDMVQQCVDSDDEYATTQMSLGSDYILEGDSDDDINESEHGYASFN